MKTNSSLGGQTESLRDTERGGGDSGSCRFAGDLGMSEPCLELTKIVAVLFFMLITTLVCCMLCDGFDLQTNAVSLHIFKAGLSLPIKLGAMMLRESTMKIHNPETTNYNNMEFALHLCTASRVLTTILG
jgi:hypothetical protein